MRLFKNYLSKAIKALFVIIFLAIVVLILSIPINYGVKKEKISLLIEYKSIKKPSDILKISGKKVKPIIYEDISKFNDFPENNRKDRYIETLLPAILIVKFNLLNEKAKTERIWNKIRAKDSLTPEDSSFLNTLYSKYKSENLKEISRKQHLHPTSIVLAQSILETGWGNSRFFIKGNNAFGIWSYNKLDKRMPASTTRDGLVIYLKKYDNIAQSVEDYFLTLANSWAFDEFREKRYDSDNPYELIWYLNKYSELRNDYVRKVGEIIVQNDLTKYDTYEIDKNNFIKIKL